MKRTLAIFTFLVLTFFQMKAQQQPTGHFATVNGLKMYYEIHGSGSPLVLIHGGGSTIYTTFGRILPELSRNHRVIAVETQSHGHTADIDRPYSFEQDADDVAALLGQLNIARADFMGFSNGGTTCLQIAIRHPQLVNKLVLASTLYKRSGMPPGFFDMMEKATLDQMPTPLQEAYKAINPDPKGLQAMFKRDSERMIAFKDIPDASIKGIAAPALVIGGDADAVQPAHALELSRTLQHAKLAILPGVHGEYIAEICAPPKQPGMPAFVVDMIETFLKE
ncbi:alpha/beta hydrolase [Chitinophaga lutea]|uniref:Alpha/beta hydrolase n=1 Tax=Chitinophaga lutea TaxID=2488634 RepID=A0A3N4PNP7_9BACT|nr:alpha/beta hydrolase [Chitinophaga lutea]RPE09228.1 alpha/beta hydrolase [Chitinophaga lutea]